MEPQDFESILEAYPVHLDNFEGPLDLLLHLIKRHEVNIYDIPIVKVTEQYLDYIDLMQDLNLDVAGDFLVMAATLIHIKSRMLLPRIDPAQEDPDEDPREALIRRLLEHQKFKAAAELLHERETLRSAQWTRPDGPIAEIAGEAPEPEIEVDLFSLISAFRTVVERAKQRPKVYLPGEQMPIEDRIEQLMARLSETEACGFDDLFADVQTRSGIVVTFLAMLEMIRLKLIRVFQSGSMGPIRVYKRARPADAPKPLLDPEKRHADEVAAQVAEQQPETAATEEKRPGTKPTEPVE
jgi:segregation and condensation protein A